MSPSTRATRSTCDTSDSTSLRHVEGPQASTDCFGVCISVNFRRRSVQSCPHVLVCWPLLGWRGVMLRCLSGVSFLCWCLMFLASSCALDPCISHALDAGVRQHRALPGGRPCHVEFLVLLACTIVHPLCWMRWLCWVPGSFPT